MSRSDGTMGRAAVALVCGALCLGVFFRGQLGDGFTLLLGDRHDGVIALSILEHWYNALRGIEPWDRTAYFFPVPATLGYNDGYLLFGLLHAAFRALGADPFLSGELVNLATRSIGFAATLALGRRLFGLPFGWALLGAALFTISNNLFIRGSHAQLLQRLLRAGPRAAGACRPGGAVGRAARRPARPGRRVPRPVRRLPDDRLLHGLVQRLPRRRPAAGLAGSGRRRRTRPAVRRAADAGLAAGRAAGAGGAGEPALPDAVPAQGGRDRHAPLGRCGAQRTGAARHAQCRAGEPPLGLAGPGAERCLPARLPGLERADDRAAAAAAGLLCGGAGLAGAEPCPAPRVSPCCGPWGLRAW
ncbi:hypothetical protein [Dankookia sp. P2]|uniref:hypothetical protein n=1 Tax=Dankookia sp. P2 TaxID=3423955 RepID=UPI003D6743F7